MWDTNTTAQVVGAIGTVIGTVGSLWWTIRRENKRQSALLAKEREDRLTRLEASVEDTLRENEKASIARIEKSDKINAARHEENKRSIDLVTNKLNRSIHEIELILARAGLNGSRGSRSRDRGPTKGGP